MNGMWIATLSIGIGLGIVAPTLFVIRGLRSQKRIADALADGRQLACRVASIERTSRTLNNDPVCRLQLHSLQAPERNWTVTQAIPLEALSRVQPDSIVALRVDVTETIAVIDFDVRPLNADAVAQADAR
ncbi:hypothetical protein [Niveibacterium sp. SC-1]|uniref:hypothetical protein n=1 Tax=Niveibacterium sp. SC-1 TaxID=3135646 RepID=UPI00311EF571